MEKSTQSPLLNTRKRVQVHFSKPSLTKQYFKEECDINNVVKRFSETGQIPNINNQNPQYGEAPEMDLKTALDTVKDLHREFGELTEQEKSRFGHNVNNYAQFLSDYEADPQSLYNQLNEETDTSVSDNTKNNEKTDSGSSDEGGRSET